MKLPTQIRQWLSILSGKPQIQVEDYVLEHLLVYHGLIGSSAEHQLQLADAITAAVEQHSIAQLATALKVPPLWWDENLNAIFEEIGCRQPQKLAAILAAGDSPETDLLASDDWRVRANAANALALLYAGGIHSEAEERLTRLLSECTRDPFKPAFIHVACALAKLGTGSARRTLFNYLHQDEPWFRVDAARALTYFSVQETAAELLTSLLDYHPLLDYTATVVARTYNMQELAQSARTIGDDTQEGFCELILGVLQAAKQSSFAQVLEETGAARTLPALLAPNMLQCSARRIRAILQLSEWVKLNHPDMLDDRVNEQLVQFKRAAPELAESIKLQLKQAVLPIRPNENRSTPPPARESDIKHTIALVGELKLVQLTEQLIAVLDRQFVALDETITALGQLGNTTAAAPLVQIAQRLIDLDERINLPPRAQPADESQSAATNSYWLILGALGQLPHQDSLVFLIRAAHDYAPDKRAQAVKSLIKICNRHSAHQNILTESDTAQIKKLLSRALKDPSSEVRKAALPGIAELQLTELLPMVRKNCSAKERSLSEEAFAVFRRLYTQGLQEPVLRELKRGAALTLLNSNLRQRYEQLAVALAG